MKLLYHFKVNYKRAFIQAVIFKAVIFSNYSILKRQILSLELFFQILYISQQTIRSQQPRSKLTGHQTCNAAERNISLICGVLTPAAVAIQ
jgi:hypothetical protein